MRQSGREGVRERERKWEGEPVKLVESGEEDERNETGSSNK